MEIDPESLSEAMNEADKLAQVTGVNTDVVGWYHSHPNITVFPSQVDINTQFRLQVIGSHFIGLIFSVFVVHNQTNKSELIAFQSYDDINDGIKKARTLRVIIVDNN